MISLMCQVDWAVVCPDIWSNITLGVAFLVKIILQSVDWVKQSALPNV